MKTAYELVPTEMYVRGNTTGFKPYFRQGWSNLRKLRWKASIIMLKNPGVKIYIQKGRQFRNGIFEYGQFSLSINNMGMSAMDFEHCWDMLVGIAIGLEASSFKK